MLILSIWPASVVSARTADFQYYTLDVPDDWVDVGPGGIPMRSLDGRLEILPGGVTVLTGGEPGADGSPDRTAIIAAVDHIKNSLAANPGRLGIPMVRDFDTEDLGEYRSIMRAVFRANPSTVIVLYYIIGPTYVVPFSVASKFEIDDSIAKLDPIFSSLKWIGKP